jgi:tetratricopeptide (TPR) repeat protein
MDVNQLVLWSLLKLVEAKKDRSHRLVLRQSAFEYALLAHTLDPSNAMALNILANHRFHAWQSVDLEGECQVNVDTLILPFSSPQSSVLSLLRSGNQVRLLLSAASGNGSTTEEERWSVHTIADVSQNNTSLMLTLRPAVRVGTGGAAVHRLEAKHLQEVAELAQRALSSTNVKSARGESFYILGKVAHAQGDAKSAYAFYRNALGEVPDMALAAFGAAQTLFAFREYDQALELFEKVLKSCPEDKDTLAYVLLLRGTQRGEAAGFDKLKDCASGFQFETDLWLSQGQLRHRREQREGPDFAGALRCYHHALDCLAARGLAPSPSLLNNIAVLYSVLGKPDKACEHFVRALSGLLDTLPSVPSSGDWRSPVLRELSLCSTADTKTITVECTARSPRSASFRVVDADAVEFVDKLIGGDCVFVGDCEYTVDNVENDCVHCSALFVPFTVGDQLTLRVPLRRELVRDEVLGVLYNLARTLEDLGQSVAAMEIYSQLVRKHPSIIDCMYIFNILYNMFIF